MNKNELLVLKPRWTQAGETAERFEQEASFALQHYYDNKLLQKCTKESILQSVFNVALTGLSLNPVLKHAALVPRWDSKNEGYQCSLEPQYQGLIALALKSGTVKAIMSNLVYEGDDIDMDYANTKKIIRHKPYIITGNDQGQVRAVYAIAVMPDGTELGEVMSAREVDDIRDRSESYKAYKAGKIKSTVWVSDYGEMARKTVVKRLIKYLSKESAPSLMKAVSLDNDIHGFRPLVDASQLEYITHLIEDELVVDDQTLNRLRIRAKNLTFRDEANDLIDDIFNNYVQEGQNLRQSDIMKQIEKKVEQKNT